MSRELKSLTRGLAQTYTMRFVTQFGWARITIDAEGFFSCQSDWGDFQHRWNSIGRDEYDDRLDAFKDFLTDIDHDYFLRKTVGRKGQVFNFEKSIKSLREHVIESRKDGDLTKEKAREIWKQVEWVEHTDDPTYYVVQVCDQGDLTDALYCGDLTEVDVAMEWSPCHLYFAQEILPIFQQELLKELAIKKGRSKWLRKSAYIKLARTLRSKMPTLRSSATS